MSQRRVGVYGDRLAEHVRLVGVPSLSTKLLRGPLFAATRLTCRTPNHGMTVPLPAEDAYSLSLQLRDFFGHDLWLDGRPVLVQPTLRGEVTLLDLTRSPRAYLRDPFDSLHFYIPREALDALAEDLEVAAVSALQIAPGASVRDPVVAHLGAALLPALEHPESVSGLFVDHVAMALQVHLAQTYGELKLRQSRRTGVLSPTQEQRAKELLAARLDNGLSLHELARECGLSRSHFARAFKLSTGYAPHQWRSLRRIERAKLLLSDPKLSLGEVALSCGFVDQSHFTRAFAKSVGLSPGAWRRRN